MVAEAGVHCMVVISLKQMFAGHSRQAAAIASACNDIARNCTWNIVVDDDIDPSNISEILWALGTRTDPAQIDVLKGCRTSRGLPIIPIEQLKSGVVQQNRGVIFACKPYNMINRLRSMIRFDLSGVTIKHQTTHTHRRDYRRLTRPFLLLYIILTSVLDISKLFRIRNLHLESAIEKSTFFIVYGLKIPSFTEWKLQHIG